MKAILKPLKSKYYGTKIKVIGDNGIEADIEIWDNGDYTPSVREIEQSGFTQEDWDNNILIDNGWDDSKIPIREAEITDSSHFESKQSYEFALRIINKLNSSSIIPTAKRGENIPNLVVKCSWCHQMVCENGVFKEHNCKNK